MNVAEYLVNLLEKDNVEYIFGHPGEQILPFYNALSKSSIKHILTRHEQGAAHACDSYARSTGKYGVCVATAGPGAMNLVMGVATAFKDSVPMLVITGDNDYNDYNNFNNFNNYDDYNDDSNYDNFQSFPLNDIFENITVKTFHPANAKEAVSNFKEALNILKYYPKGPVYINLSKDVALFDICDCDVDNVDFDENIAFNQSNIDNDINLAIEKISNAEKPLIVAGNGIVWGQAIELLNEFVSKHRVPVTTTYPARGVLSEYDDLNLGMCGLRASAMSEYAYLNSDCIIVLGARLSERTIAKSPNDEFFDRIIHVNIDDKCLKGGINLCMDVKEFLNCLLDSTINKYEESAINDKYDEWIDEIYAHDNALIIDGIEDIEANYNPLRAPYAINKIMGAFEGAYFLSDAGTHTTWTTLLAKCDRFAKLLFSGGFGPMGYGLPAAIGVAVAHPDEKVVVVCGDGDIQMVSQELATIHEYGLNIAIFVINNSQLGIIRQWQDTVYDFDEHYQVDLINPDFVKLAESYGIGSFRASDKDSLLLAIDEALCDGPCLVDVCVVEENIPMPK